MNNKVIRIKKRKTQAEFIENLNLDCISENSWKNDMQKSASTKTIIYEIEENDTLEEAKKNRNEYNENNKADNEVIYVEKFVPIEYYL